MSVICLVEHDAEGLASASKRALTFARSAASQLDAPLDAMVVGVPSSETEDALGAYGVLETHVAVSARLSSYAPLAWARALLELSVEKSAVALVTAATDRGNEVLAHVGAISGEPMAANCLSVETVRAGYFHLTRYRWAGSLLEEAVLTGNPGLMTVVPDAAPDVPAPGGATAIREWEPTFDDETLSVAVVETEARPPGSTSLGEARVVVGGGRGLGSAEAFSMLDELAGELGGVVGVSRVVTSNGWRPHAQQVGQTGTKINPDLYLACGISGAIQHLAGCRGAKTLIAINTDPEAPIMARADYAVIGDVNEIVPALTHALRARASS
ncbi:MAG: electron transfer flavoprotein subunit alpha/FixB family protein [Acidimicrobiales bacterium]